VKGPYIDHIGIIVENMDESISLFERLFGVRPVAVKELHEVGLRILHQNGKRGHRVIGITEDTVRSHRDGIKARINHIAVTSRRRGIVKGLQDKAL
jgi:catechol 2,3-dioxygenase-like lactoylglutathione lyase family enzyme